MSETEIEAVERDVRESVERVQRQQQIIRELSALGQRPTLATEMLKQLECALGYQILHLARLRFVDSQSFPEDSGTS